MGLKSLELWGGLECTVARIGDGFRDQTAETGHDVRPSDLESVRALGIETLRYPVLWENVAPRHPDDCDWSWPDERLGHMLRLGLRPIVGLLHHGSGPRYSSLLDPALPDMLARHAERVAARYPWVDRFTPVNEPLTTARFSALYGQWYPHATALGAFVRAVVIQCKATVLAMRAIRRIRPRAQLIQTEDLGRTFSTPALAYQADHDNERRWLSLDLLCGKVDQHHPWHEILVRHGVTAADLDLFLEADAAPDVIGINHYLTSERYLDEDLGTYAPHHYGSNGRQSFADVEAVRVPHLAGLLGPEARLREAWDRYRRPLAVTEVHHGCTRDEQLRWLAEVWKAADALRLSGCDIRAVTIWALFGAFDWNSLLTERRGFYEPGAFDVRAPQPRPTALARASADLARVGRFEHPVLDTAGWWHRPERCYGAPRPEPALGEAADSKFRSLLVRGASRPLSAVFARMCAVRGLQCVLADNIPGSADSILSRANAWAVVDVGFDPEEGIDENEREASQAVAQACARNGLPFVTLSSDRVFDGCQGRPYDEADEISPIDRAGRSAALYEGMVQDAHPDALIVRTGLLLDAWDAGNVGVQLLDDLARGNRPKLPDLVISPAFAPDLAHTVLDLLIDGESGIWHLPNRGELNLGDLPDRLARAAGWTRAGAAPVRTPTTCRALVSRRGWPMPSLEDALARFVHDVLAERQLNLALAAE